MLFLNSPTFSIIKQICWNFPTLWFMDLKNNSNLSHKITESMNGIWLNITLLLQNEKSPIPYVENYGTIRLFILILNAVTKSSIFQDIRMAGIGVVIRDSEGEVIANSLRKNYSAPIDGRRRSHGLLTSDALCSWDWNSGCGVWRGLWGYF